MLHVLELGTDAESVFVLQVAADVKAAVQEVEAALQLLQKRVLCFLLNTIFCNEQIEWKKN